MYTTRVKEYQLDAQKLERLLDKSSKPARQRKKTLSKNARRKLKRYGKIPKA